MYQSWRVHCEYVASDTVIRAPVCAAVCWVLEKRVRASPSITITTSVIIYREMNCELFTHIRYVFTCCFMACLHVWKP